jgi:phosphoserine phosphatase RsbU/P
LEDEVLALLRDQIAEIMFGAVFLFGGLVTCFVAVTQRRSGVRIFLWLGTWSAIYGARLLTQSPAVFAALPHWAQSGVPYVNTVISYLLVVVASLAFLELSLGWVRLFLHAVIIVGLAIALAGIGFFLWTGDTEKLMLPNNLLAVCALLVLITVVTVPRLASKFLVLPHRGVLAVGTLVFALQALYTNLTRVVQLPYLRIFDHLGFAILLFSFGYVAMQMILTSERRLLAIESELEIARQLQFSILPTTIPEIRDVGIAAAYQPMTAVAGDFYEFLAVDQHRAGLLIADVSGHGVPAALIASMIKVAMQSVVSCAHDPREVLRGLNRVLAEQLREQFVSAAYLWLDMENRKASYSAAGHPPLLLWREGTLERIESNGQVFGFLQESDYPVRDMPLRPGDRFLLYTDGVVEPENAAGEFFGDHKLEQVIRQNQSQPPSELSDQLLSEIRRWRPASIPQQDDITIIVIDIF